MKTLYLFSTAPPRGILASTNLQPNAASTRLTTNEKDFELDQIDLRELFNTLLRGKKLVILVTAICSVCSVLYALSLDNYYKSESVMSIRDGNESQGILSQFSGAASLMGVNLSSSGDNKPQQVIQLIQSSKIIKKDIEEAKVLLEGAN